MAGELSLFSDDPTEEAVQPVATEAPIADWLVNDIRAALTAGGSTAMAERQQAVEVAVGRPVQSLRSLTRAEALRVLSLLRSTQGSQTVEGRHGTTVIKTPELTVSKRVPLRGQGFRDVLASASARPPR